MFAASSRACQRRFVADPGRVLARVAITVVVVVVVVVVCFMLWLMMFCEMCLLTLTMVHDDYTDTLADVCS